MEKLRITKPKIRATMLVAALALTGCASEQVAGTPKTSLSAENLLNRGDSVHIRPGDSALITPITDEIVIKNITDKILEVDHQYPHGFIDDKAPTISRTPLRIDANEALSGKSPVLENDLACDTVNVDLTGSETGSAYITAFAMSDSPDDTVLVSWPVETPDRVYVCFADNNELTDGLVMVLNDQPR